ncbi:hypothetical protein CAPTEDRAFT_215926 [Capitella teleta]|uniref:Uncharacterized protein n=1 Tax=Capitella teleta TaxID=283909 RepID=R7VDC8_CAPTE|nr:hypothetical protein CAPTEDRAFT_215926 [Capitella teleta]|eukprot:ELU14306.1 hypothetical protein CAPTEDRAFT_215926 [Capitella teleta]
MKAGSSNRHSKRGDLFDGENNQRPAAITGIEGNIWKHRFWLKLGPSVDGGLCQGCMLLQSRFIVQCLYGYNVCTDKVSQGGLRSFDRHRRRVHNEPNASVQAIGTLREPIRQAQLKQRVNCAATLLASCRCMQPQKQSMQSSSYLLTTLRHKEQKPILEYNWGWKVNNASLMLMINRSFSFD